MWEARWMGRGEVVSCLSYEKASQVEFYFPDDKVGLNSRTLY